MALLTITATELKPTPLTEIPADYECASLPCKINPGYAATVAKVAPSLITSFVNCYNGANAELVKENAAPPNDQKLWTISYFSSLPVGPSPDPNTPAADAAGRPAGSLYVRIAQDGDSAYTPPAPVVAKAAVVFGLAVANGRAVAGAPDGLNHSEWTMGAGTTYPQNVPFEAGAGMENTTLMNPGQAQPPVGWYEIYQGYMGQYIAYLGNTPGW